MVVAFAAQLAASPTRGRREWGRPAGRAGAGRAYFFTVAMLPAHKESVRLHPLEFALGVVLHAGALAALAGSLILVVHPASGLALLARIRPLLALAAAAGLYLLVRRVATADLRAMSVPDDYLAVAATCGLVIVAALAGIHPVMPALVLAYAAALLVYAPLGKLRHAVFFFAARADYGRRLGLRGVYPPPPVKVG